MTRQIINIGSGELAGDGESLRAAFTKTNANFEEIYNSVAGLNDGQINTDIKGSVFGNDSSLIVDGNTGKVYSTSITGGAIQIAGNTINTVDSSNILITQTAIVSSDLIMQADIIPDIDSKYNLGSPTNQWKSLYVSNSTIFINNNALSINQDGELLINGGAVSGGGNLGNLSVIDYKLTGDFLDLESTVNGINIYTAQSASINLTSGYQFVIQDRDDSDIALTLNPHQGYIQLREGHRIFDDPAVDTGLNVRGGPTGRPIYIYAYGSDGDGTSAGNISITNDDITISTRWHGDGIGQHAWTFGTDGNLTLPADGDIVNSSGNSVLGGSVVERSISFPNGESGDTRGTIALTPEGETYICTADWQDASTGLQGTFSATTAELYNISQSGNVFNSAVLSIADEPEIYNILRYGSWSEGQFTVDAGVAYGGAQNVTSTGYNDQTGLMSILWLHRAEDPEELAQGSSVTIAYTGGGTQTPIWKRLVDLVSGGEGSGLGKINWRSEGDLTIETLRPQGYTGDCDLNLYAADDVFITANGDEVSIQANTNVTIESDDGNHAWTFAQNGSLQLPGLNNTGYQNGYSLNGPTLRLGGENDPNDQVIITGPEPDSNTANAQRLVIQGQRGYGDWNQPVAGEGGDVYIWGGVGGEGSDGGNYYGGSGGDIKIRGGQGQNANGGYVKIEGGDAAGWNNSPTGGYVEINGGDGLYSNSNGGDVNIRGGRAESGGSGNNGQVYIRTGVNSEHEWQFKTNGDLQLPTGGDIVDSNGSSVLGGGGGGEPTISNTVKGFINLVGDRPNNEDDAIFESVVVRGGYAYALGTDYYIANSNNRVKVYKFDVNTGEQVWVKQITAGRGAQFNVTVGEGIITVDLVSNSGVDYKAGEEIPFRGDQIGGSNPQNDFVIIVDTIDGSGGVNTASVKPGYDAGALSGSYTGISSYANDAYGDTVAISYDDFNNKLIVVQEYEAQRGDQMDAYWQWANVYVIDPATGVINQTVTLSDEGDIYPNSIATYDAPGGVAIVGEKYNEYREFGPLTILQGGTGFFDILKSNLDPEHYPGADVYNSSSDFWITGTGITGQNNVDGVNVYTGLTGTTREGSGAQFQVVSAGDGIAYVSALATVPNKGTNYLVGHKIKILGTDLGGATPANDAIITVTEIGAGGSIEAVTISGTGGDVGGGTYNGLTGTNYNVGSGFTLDCTLTSGSNIYDDSTVENNVTGGSNYVVGDIITIAGNNFSNGSSTANDMVITVTTVDGSGAVTGRTYSGTRQNNSLRIVVNGVDFTVVGTWSMRQNLGGEAFIWTPTWTNAIGGPSSDRFYDVCWAADGQSLYAVGRGVYEVPYDQALVVKFDASDGSVVWGKDIKFTEASTNNREARAVAVIPGSTDIMVAGAWYNNSIGYTELILTRMTDAGAAVWQKTYSFAEDFYENTYYIDYEISLKATDNGMIVSVEQGTDNGRGLGWLQIDPTNGTVIRHRVLSADGNSNNNYYNTPTANWADVYTDADGDHIVMAGYTYVPTDSYYNALLVKLPITGVKNLEFSEKLNLGEHILTRHNIYVTTVTPAFDSFTPDEHVNTITGLLDQRNYKTRAPDGELRVWTYTVTDDSAGFLEFGDGSKQSFATNIIPQIPAANDYYLTEQDSGKHIFFEHENGWVYIPHWQSKQLPVGFTFTVVNTTGSDCYVRTATGPSNRGRLKLAGRNIDTYVIGIPDSGSGSMVTFLKVKEGYTMDNSDGLGDYPDVWMVSGPGDIYDND